MQRSSRTNSFGQASTEAKTDPPSNLWIKKRAQYTGSFERMGRRHRMGRKEGGKKLGIGTLVSQGEGIEKDAILVSFKEVKKERKDLLAGGKEMHLGVSNGAQKGEVIYGRVKTRYPVLLPPIRKGGTEGGAMAREKIGIVG